MTKFKMYINKIKYIKEFKIGIFFLIFLLLIILFTPDIANKDPNILYDSMLSKPSFEHLFGTDGLGKDVYSMVIHGTKTSLKIGILVASISTVIGTLIGAVSGYIGGRTDKIISEILNMFMMLPSFFLILIVLAIYGSNLNNMIIVMALTSWTGTARLMRGQALSLKEKNFIKSAKTTGENHMMIIFKHIIPNGIYPVIANATMTVSSAILSEAGLSFLGLGDPNIVSWGKIISDGKIYLPSSWWICIFPGLFLIITVLSFYLIGEGINKLLSPKLMTN